MNKTLVILNLTLILSSCGFLRKESDYTYINQPTTGDPILLNESSDSEDALYSLGGEQRELNLSLFEGTSNCSSSDLVDTTFKSGSFEWMTIKRWTYEKTLKLAKIYNPYGCDENALPGTYEHAASTILNQIRKTDILLKEQTSLTLSKVNIRVVPLIKEKLKKYDGKTVTLRDAYIVNNAYYKPQGKEILFFPQGIDEFDQIPYGGVPLWNIPFVVSHEYGHHMFRELLGDKAHKKAHLCFSKAKKNRVSKKPISNEELVSAVNEGFADLVGQISSHTSFTFDGVPGFEMTRDLNSSNFQNGVAKKLSQRHVQFILNSKQNYDPHYLGAILAHGIYTAMKNADIVHFQSLIDWANEIKIVYRPHESVRSNLDAIVAAFVRSSSVGDKTDIVCKSFKKTFPALDLSRTCN